MRKLTLRGMVALTVIVAIVCIAGVAIGGDAPLSYPASPGAPQVRSAGDAPVDMLTAPQIDGLAATGNALPTLVINEVMPLGDNEHFGLTNPGTVKVNLGDFHVSIDRRGWIKLPEYNLAPGEEVNVLFDNKKPKLTELNEPGQDNLYIDAPDLTLNDRFGTVTVKDDAGVVSELTYDNHPLYLTQPT